MLRALVIRSRPLEEMNSASHALQTHHLLLDRHRVFVTLAMNGLDLVVNLVLQVNSRTSRVIPLVLCVQ